MSISAPAESLLKYQRQVFLAAIPTTAVSGSVGLEWKTRICLSNKGPGDPAALAPEAHFEKLFSK